MTETSGKSELARIEDFIALALKGEKVTASVVLREQSVIQKVHHQQTEDMDNELDMYILIGDFTFVVGADEKKISKSYVFGSKESTSDLKINKNIANARLKADYKRLREAKIKLTEKLF